MKKTLRLLAVLFCSFVAVETVLAQSGEPLRVGVAPTSPPIRFWEQNKIVGLEVDFAEALGKELGRPIEYVDMKFSQLIPSLIHGDIDIIMSGMSVTHVRSLQIAFSDPYLRVRQMALVRAEDKNNFLSTMDIVMTDKRVGAKENTTAEFLIVQEFPNAKKTLFKSPEDGASALKKKKIDLMIMDSPYVWWSTTRNEGKLVPLPYGLTEEALAWGVNRTNTDLLASVNAALAKWKTNGQWTQIINKWIPGFQQ